MFYYLFILHFKINLACKSCLLTCSNPLSLTKRKKNFFLNDAAFYSNKILLTVLLLTVLLEGNTFEIHCRFIKNQMQFNCKTVSNKADTV